MADIPKPDLPENGGTSVPTNEPSAKAQSPPDKKSDPPVVDDADRSAPDQKPRVVGIDFSAGLRPSIENGANPPGPPGNAIPDLKEPGRDQKAGPEAAKGPASLPVRDKVSKKLILKRNPLVVPGRMPSRFVRVLLPGKRNPLTTRKTRNRPE